MPVRILQETEPEVVAWGQQILADPVNRCSDDRSDLSAPYYDYRIRHGWVLVYENPDLRGILHGRVDGRVAWLVVPNGLAGEAAPALLMVFGGLCGIAPWGDVVEDGLRGLLRRAGCTVSGTRVTWNG